MRPTKDRAPSRLLLRYGRLIRAFYSYPPTGKDLAEQGASFVLEDGTRGDFPADFVLYYSDATYQWSPINQLKRALKSKIADSKLSVRVLADALNTSPAQVVRLLEENRASKQFLQLSKLAQVAGYNIEFTLKKKPAA